jgi:hypothetical protein
MGMNAFDLYLECSDSDSDYSNQDSQDNSSQSRCIAMIAILIPI